MLKQGSVRVRRVEEMADIAVEVRRDLPS